ncbi:ABC transporter ATP-binding protein [Erwiniaceae bacterium BAC15a-03b]|uniref:ABC-type dipeptide transporter n=1 Tax=Winslowiella arboricola TaxID=2978220 RepID=A0A9J6PQM9_9GAMM|nr:ABC transporter ATP-binding protein [Winslowiella arboricola]MCU5779038.1 ABC transporter ATP-binding protein [Winslowiella arboricola]
MTTPANSPLLTVEHLQVKFATGQGVVSPVRDLSFSVNRHEIVGIIGESGCGKSVTVQALMGLLPSQTSAVSGELTLDGVRLDQLSPRQQRQRCGSEMAMIFQDPLSSLNPVFTVGDQIDESLKLHTSLKRNARRSRILALLTEVGIDDAPRCAAAYPHEISGGMRQRVMIAIAIASQPALLIADEPTTALDVTIQAQILSLLQTINQQNGMGILLITHDLSVVAQLCQRVLVMYYGEVVEQADVISLFNRPLHPYTQALMAARPGLQGEPKSRLREISGTVPDLHAPPGGCSFAPRCPQAEARCHQQSPLLRSLPVSGHAVRCWLAELPGEAQ